MFIEMSGFSIKVQKKKIKNINLRISHVGEVQVSAPIKMPMHVIYSFLHDKSAWIERHRSRLVHQKIQPSHYWTTGEYVPFQGVNYELIVREVHEAACVKLEGEQLFLCVPPKTPHELKEQLIHRWYYLQMEHCLPALFEKWQSIMNVSVNKISIKHMISRWGSCHPIKKNITLNLRLIEKPLICLEYVIVHELVHLFEASHNHRFHALMNHYLPNWKEIKKKLSY